MIRAIVIGTLLASTVPALADEPAIRLFPRPTSHAPRTPFGQTPGIRIWTSGDDLVHRGDRVRVFYRTERDAYVSIFRVDTDGRVRLIFPRSPDEENYGYGGATYTVSGADNGTAFSVDDYAGVGYLFGIASTAPFNYDAIYSDGRWDLHAISDGRIHGDPLTSLEELGTHLLPENFADFDTHLLPYYVEQRYSYPRFVCYDCHAYVPYTYWDPYLAWCRRYTLVVWNDPYYYYPSYWYPSRYYGGTRVVYNSPGGSRYVFKNRDNAAPGIDYRDRRTTTVAAQAGGGRRVADDRGVRGTDVGGTGSIPAPRAPGRRISDGAVGSGESPRERDPRSGDVATPGAGRQQPDAGRRRVDTPSPGIEIVPGRSEARPPDPRRSGGAAGTAGTGTGTEPVAAPGRRGAPDAAPLPTYRPVQPTRSGDEPRPPRPEGAPARPPVEVRKPEDQPRPDRTPEARPERAPESRPAPQSKPAERAPESRPERAPASRPESRPQASPPARESRPPANNPGLVRRRNP